MENEFEALRDNTLEGKTILKVETWTTGIEITFTDGSKLEVTSWGSEDHCITIEVSE